MQPGGDRPHRPDRVRGRAGRPQAHRRRRAGGCGRPTTPAPSAVLPRPARHRRRSATSPLELRFEATEEAAAELSVALVEARRGDPRARAAQRDARGPLLPPHRGRRRRARPAGPPTATERARPPDGRRCAPSTAGSCASSSPRSGPTSASARRSLVPIIFVVALALQSGQPERRRLRALRAPVGARRPAGDPHLRLLLAVPAHHRARRRGHRRRRGPQRHAEDDPDAVGGARADLRREGPGRADLRPRRARGDGRSRRSWRASRSRASTRS